MSFNLFDWFKDIGTDLVANRSIPFDGDGNELTDGEGNLNVKQSGSILALNPDWTEGDPIENKYLELTTEEDNDGNAVLRIVDAAPFAYDSELEAKRITNVDTPYAEEVEKRETIRDTDTHNISINPEQYKDYSVYVINQLQDAENNGVDVDVELRLRDAGRFDYIYNEELGTWESTGSSSYKTTIEGDYRIYWLNTRYPFLTQIAKGEFYLRVDAVSSPTQGDLRVGIRGIPNA